MQEQQPQPILIQVGKTTAAVDASAVTEITGTAASAATVVGAGITDAANVTATVDAGSAAAADLITMVVIQQLQLQQPQLP